MIAARPEVYGAPMSFQVVLGQDLKCGVILVEHKKLSVSIKGLTNGDIHLFLYRDIIVPILELPGDLLIRDMAVAPRIRIYMVQVGEVKLLNQMGQEVQLNFKPLVEQFV